MLKVTLVCNNLFYYIKLPCDSNTEKYLSCRGKIAEPDFSISFKKENLQLC